MVTRRLDDEYDLPAPQPASAAQPTVSSTQRIIGAFLVVPALLGWLLTLLWPTISTMLTSFTNNKLIGESEWVGMLNYSRIFTQPNTLQAIGLTLSMVLVRLLFVGILPPLLGLVAARSGRAGRTATRLLLSLPLLVCVPVALGIGWVLATGPLGVLGSSEGRPLLADPDSAPWMLRIVDGLIAFAVACGLGVTAYMAALRDQEGALRLNRPFVLTWALSLLAAAALPLASFTLPFVMTNGGPARATTTVGLLMYLFSFQQLQLGAGAAIATVLLLVLGLFGLAAWAIITFGDLRIESARPRSGLGTSGGLGLVGLLVLLPLALIIAGANFVPLRTTFGPQPFPTREIDLGEIVPVSISGLAANTFVPPLIGLLLVQLPLAYLAALGIGALRPLGKRSEWLLLPFAPWLFVGTLPLAIAFFERLRTLGLIDTLLGLMPPIAVNVALLFALTLFFKGQERQWRKAQATGENNAFIRTVLLPSLPFTALVASIALFVLAQDFFWQLVVANSLENSTLPLLVVQLRAQFATTGGVIGAALGPLLGLLAGLVGPIFLLLQAIYSEWLAIRSGE